MNRKWTLLVGAAVALTIFLVMALAVRSTDAWTVDAAAVASDARSVQHNFAFAANGVSAGGSSEMAAMYLPQARELARDADRLAEGGSLAEDVRALEDLLGAIESSAPNEGALMAVSNVAGSIASEAEVIAHAQATAPEQANERASVVDTLFGPQVIAFEILGILLTAAMIGALVIARPLGVAPDESHYVQPTPEQAEQALAVSDVKAHAARNAEADE